MSPPSSQKNSRDQSDQKVLEAQILAVLGKQSGATAVQISRTTKIDKSLVNSILYRLQRQNQVEMYTKAGKSTPHWNLAQAKKPQALSSDPEGQQEDVPPPPVAEEDQSDGSDSDSDSDEDEDDDYQVESGLILDLLKKGPLSASNLAEQLGMDKHLVSVCLQLLENEGTVAPVLKSDQSKSHKWMIVSADAGASSKSPGSDEASASAASAKAQMDESLDRSQAQSHIHYCDICKVQCSGADNYALHMKGKQHQKAAQRLEALKQAQQSMARESSQSQQQQKATSKPVQPSVEASSSDESVPSSSSASTGGAPTSNSPHMFYCDVCDVQCSGRDNYDKHIDGRKHKSAVESQQANPARTKGYQQSMEVTESAQEKLPFLDLKETTSVANHVVQHLFGKPLEFTFRDEGPAHERSFFATCAIAEMSLTVEGFGRSKQEAKKDVATKLCLKLHEIGMLEKNVPDKFRRKLG